MDVILLDTHSLPCCINHHRCIGKGQCWGRPKRSQTQNEGENTKQSAIILPETINRRNLIISTDKVVILSFSLLYALLLRKVIDGHTEEIRRCLGQGGLNRGLWWRPSFCPVL